MGIESASDFDAALPEAEVEEVLDEHMEGDVVLGQESSRTTNLLPQVVVPGVHLQQDLLLVRGDQPAYT